MRPKIEIDKEWLREKYVDDFMTTTEIAELASVSPRTIRNRLNEYGIEIRTNGPRKKPVSKEKLQLEYVEQGLSCNQIAEGEDYSHGFVRKSLHHHGIELRSRLESIWEYHGHSAMYRTHPRGHVIVASGEDMAYIHQLLAIAEGTDPHELFAGEAVVHHDSNIPWDNRPDNIEVLVSQSEHMKIHGPPHER